ncbi:tetratricopeptide repeat protein [Subsaximicrobium wynnwilliamsii]|uniref:Tetratricopeptide repeat protein n=2 Tax=Subsaximicrobium wynnwilliamsii TaxID=291179 RepID=A0A5C6ZEA4_9FLAO|nr:tetratricopeptide repeat protein [Subsaximicrobium wynnwilliamsii]TXD87047.1 tetratricopeptide repeat protein [Subsaximicrobium wynnwilliamsii]TXE01381.1 tetratricopeptide repeat protein [Subsaximicrobium wynnwilliamsii]
MLLCGLMCPLGSGAQDDKDQNTVFKTAVDQLLANTPRDYTSINDVLYPYRGDSIKLKQFISKAKNENYLEGESYALNVLGVLYRNISQYERSIKLHKKARELAQVADNVELRVISLNNVGVAYRRMNLVKPALDFHTKALDISSALKNPSQEIQHNIAVSHNSIGNIYLVLEQYDLAMKQFQKSLIIEKKEGNQLGLAINYQNIGYAYEQKGDLENALRNYKLSLDFNNQINSNLGRVICYNSIGAVYIKQKKYIDAKMIIEKALEKVLIIGDQFYVAESYINLGWVQEEMGQLEASERNLNKGLNIAKAHNLNFYIVEAGKHLSDLYAKKGNYELALQHFTEAITIEKNINNDRNLRYVNDVIIQYENEVKNREIKALANENELVKFKLERNKTIFWYSILGLAIIAASLIAVYRNRQLQQEKQILTLEQDMLRNQMNPHFIFNSLNSIKLYIINNEKENAVYYLNKFSKLIRKILVASTEKETTLADELDTMQLYMTIENIRFDDQILFNIKVEDTINTASIKIPSLILQPFLENALWHGLSSKADDKKIKLHVYRTSEDMVDIAITDNGIGRKEAAKIKSGKYLKRKSMGIAITKARLANFSKSYTEDYQINIEDLYDNSGNKAIGTRILVRIPTRTTAMRTA